MFDAKKLLDMLKNAGEIQKTLGENLKNQVVTGESGAGLVKVTMNGQFEVLSMEIDDELLKQSKKFMEDLIKAAINDATSQLQSALKDQLKNILGGPLGGLI